MLYIPSSLKRCRTCDRLKPVCAFSIERKNADKLRGVCRECRSAKRRKPTTPQELLPDGTKRCDKCQQVKPATKEFFCFRKESSKLRNSCRRCDSERASKWYEEHPLEGQRRSREWCAQNPDRHKRNCRHWIDANYDKWQAGRRAWRQANFDKRREANRRRKAKKRSLPATLTIAEWKYALEYFYGCCAYCGNPPKLWDSPPVLHQDHFIPQIKNGGYTADNIIPACSSCNSSKKDVDAQDWLMKHFGQYRTRIILKRILDYFEQVKQPK